MVMKRYLIYLNGVIVKDAQRLATIEKYYRLYEKKYNRFYNSLSLYDSQERVFILGDK